MKNSKINIGGTYKVQGKEVIVIALLDGYKLTKDEALVRFTKTGTQVWVPSKFISA